MSVTQSVKKVVFSALLTALKDIMGEDGKKSILRFAGLSQYINKEVQPSLSESISFDEFSALLKSMNSLLGHGTHAILYESGRKFALYLSPFGISLKDIIKKLEEWLGGEWSIQKDIDDPDVIHITVKNNPISQGITSSNPVCHIISGTLARFKEEATGEKFLVKEIMCIAMGNETCEFIIKPEKATKIKEKIS
ncbi:MAG: hypothetical protein HWN67_08725 [Candidatus Helarchaeota archaeon]|nr:hypothetical protein [Candidatus Helarchaeota archaeon]